MMQSQNTMSQQTILVTLANGKQCRSLIPLLLADPHVKVRAFVHSEKSADRLLSDFGNTDNLETFVGDLLSVNDVDSAMENVHTVFHVGPPMSVHESHIGIIVIKAAEKAGVQYFIFSSVLHPIRSKLLNHDVKRQVEEYLIESSLNWTILQPAHFMQNTNPAEASRKGALLVAYNPDNEMGFIDLRDIAQVTKNILENPEKHYRARYELCGENMSYTAYAQLISKLSGKPVKANKIDGNAVAKKISNGDRDFEDRMGRMFFYCSRMGVGNHASNTGRIHQRFAEREILTKAIF
jgi:uncharacterized protein YbjT (DUF2867 family)